MNAPSPEPPVVGMSRVASWRPGRFYAVYTQDQSGSPLHRLTRSLEQGVAYADAQTDGSFVTVVYHCDRGGVAPSGRHTVWSCEYTSLAAARAGHERIVNLLFEGRVRLRNGLNGLLQAREVED